MVALINHLLMTHDSDLNLDKTAQMNDI